MISVQGKIGSKIIFIFKKWSKLRNKINKYSTMQEYNRHTKSNIY